MTEKLLKFVHGKALIGLLFLFFITPAFSQAGQEKAEPGTEQEWTRERVDSLVKSIREYFDELLDVELGWAALQARHLSNVGYGIDNRIGLNGELRDTLEFLRNVFESELFVKSMLKYDHFWPNLINRKQYSPKPNELEKQHDGLYAQSLYFDIVFYPSWDTVAMDVDAAREAGKIGYKCTIAVNGLGQFEADLDGDEMSRILNGLITGKEYTKIKQQAGPDVNESMMAGLGWLAEKFDYRPFDDPTNIKRVDFYAPVSQNYGYDAYENAILSGNYDNVSIKGKQYHVPWKSVAISSTESIKAIVKLKEEDRPAGAELKFVTTTGQPTGTVTQVNDTTYEIVLPPVTSEGEFGLLATYSYKNEEDKEITVNAGQANISGYTTNPKKVVIVPVNGNKAGLTATGLKKALDEIYKQAATTWDVKIYTDNLQVKSVYADDGKLDDGETGFLSNYTKEMNAVIEAFKDRPGVEIDKNTCYLFLVDKAKSGPGKCGFMPLKRPFGFIFTDSRCSNNISHTIAHELGHGPFRLYHTFSSENEYTQGKGTTDNLMDYMTSTEKLGKNKALYKYQWDLIHDPEAMIALFQDKEEGAMMSDYLVLKIEELAKSLGLKLGENAFVTVHSFRCSNIGDLGGASPLDVSGYSNLEFTKFKPQRIIIANSDNEGNADVVNIAILFKVNDNEVEPEDKSSTGIVLPGMEPPFLGVLQESGELVECLNQLSMLDEFGCVDDNSLVAQFAEEDYRGLYISKVLTAIHECLEEQEIDNSEGKVGDLFYTEYLKDAESEEEINQLKQVADLFNRIGDVLFANNNATTWQEYGDFIRASYDAYKQAEQEKPFSDYLSRLEGLISDYEHRKELLEKFEDREKVAILVNTFSDAELEFLPMELRAHSLNVLSSKELRGALRLSGHNEEELTLRLLRFIKSEEISSLIDELKKGDLLNTIDKGFNDLFTLVDDNYAGLLDVIDDYVLQTKGITDGEAKTEKLVELHEQNRFYNLTDDQEGKKYISAAKVLSEGKVSITISTITGYDIVYVKQADGPSVPEIKPTIQSETVELPFDEPMALYHNAYLDGVDASKRGEIELASALKLHYYLQCNKNENIKTTASVIIDVGSLAVGVGVISGGIKGVRLVLAICDVASSTISLLSTGSEKYLIDKYGADGQAYVNSMQMISAVLGFVDLGATGAGRLKNLLKDDVVTAGAFYAKHGTELASDAKTTELATQTKKIVDEFTDYDDEIARLIDNAGDLGGVFTYDITKVADHIKAAIRSRGYVDADIEELIKINQLAAYGNATEAQLLKARKIAEECFDMPTAATKMRKVLPIEDVNAYHLGNANISSQQKMVGGFVAKVEDVEVKNAEQMFNDLRLDYDGTKFSKDKGFATIEYDNVGNPVRPYNSAEAHTFGPPNTLTGTTGAYDKIVPEFKLDNMVELQEGAILRIYNKDGVVFESYKLDKNVWEKR